MEEIDFIGESKHFLKFGNLICAQQSLQSLFTKYWIFVVSKKIYIYIYVYKSAYMSRKINVS